MKLRKLLKKALEDTARNVSILFRKDFEPPRVEYKYNPRLHATFYVVTKAIVQTLLDNSEAYTARLFSEETGYAASTIRLVCKLLASDGILVRIQEFPAAYKLTSKEVGKDRLEALSSIP